MKLYRKMRLSIFSLFVATLFFTSIASASTMISFAGLAYERGEDAITTINNLQPGVSFDFANRNNYPYIDDVLNFLVLTTDPAQHDGVINFDLPVSAVTVDFHATVSPGKLLVAYDQNIVPTDTGLNYVAIASENTTTATSLTVTADCIRSVVMETQDSAFAVYSFSYTEMTGTDTDLDGEVDVCDADDDNDSVLDEADACPATMMSADTPSQPKKNRYFVNDAGQFVDGEGNASGYTIADTAGCSSKQIIEAAGLGNGHIKHGLSRSELEAWIASQS